MDNLEPRDTEPIGLNAEFRAYDSTDELPHHDLEGSAHPMDYSYPHYRAYGNATPNYVRDALDLPHETWVDQYECLANNLEMLMEGFSLGRNDSAYEALALMERNVVYAREWMEAHELPTEEAKVRVTELWQMLQYHSPQSS